MTLLSASFTSQVLQLTFNQTVTNASGWRGFTLRGATGLEYIPASIQVTTGNLLRLNMIANGPSSGGQRTDFDGTPFISNAGGGVLQAFAGFPTT